MSSADGAPSSGSPTSEERTDKPSDERGERFECNICLDVASDAVISLCGHLFCWPCLHRWIETRPSRPVCPVCKAGIAKDKVIPIYGKDNPERKDPRDKKLPPRPQAQRPEPETSFNPFQSFGFGNAFGMGGVPGGNPAAGNGAGNPLGGAGGGFQFSFGVGAFPFSFLATTFGANQNQAPAGSPQAQEEQFLSRAFLWIAVFFLLWLLIA